MKHVLVTGATGFIGNHLCRVLAKAGFKVRGLYRHIPPSEPNIEWVQVPDIAEQRDWSQALRGIDDVVHLAGLAHRIGAEEEKAKGAFYQVNTEGSRRLLTAIAQQPIPGRFVFISSIKVYGSFTPNVLTEQTACRPDTEYGDSKLQAERLVATLLDSVKVDWCVVRPCLVYGPGNLGNMARLIKLVRLGFPAPFGAIQNQKSFIYVGNLVDAIQYCLTHDTVSRSTYLLSDGRIVSTAELFRMLAEAASRKPRLLNVPEKWLWCLARVGDRIGSLMSRSVGWDSYAVERLCGSLAVAPSALVTKAGWMPPFTMETGLACTIRKKNNIEGDMCQS
jgi:nucleoside-diphosphate-sugar epimerase